MVHIRRLVKSVQQKNNFLFLNLNICCGYSKEAMYILISPGCVALQTADPGVAGLIPAQSHTFVETDHEIISRLFSFLPLIQEGLLSVTNKSMCTKYWLTA